MRRARFVAEARQEFLAEVAYYNEAQSGLGASFTKAVEEATARALSFPLSGTPSASNTRRISLNGFPFSLFYRPEDSGIVIFATAHHARKPRYWVCRIRDR
ncbi:MAG: type II toxin-antitoxin system RelE/ParE family toxin [Nitrosomonadales bacterium]|nr:type II toxin-antitoxin system RelE/ParE family toxin [Nitrosomonadales bacterium]